MLSLSAHWIYQHKQSSVIHISFNQAKSNSNKCDVISDSNHQQNETCEPYHSYFLPIITSPILYNQQHDTDLPKANLL
jgi:hypothetical protein